MVWYGVVRCDIFFMWCGVNAVMYFSMVLYLTYEIVVECSRVVVLWLCGVVLCVL